jgi:HEAT repeat protein
MRQKLEEILNRERDAACAALAAELLGEVGNPDSVAQLRRSARGDPYWIVRQRALESLGRLLGSAVAEDIEAALANDAEPQVRAAAVSVAYEQLAGHEEQELIEILDKALADEAVEVRLRASRLLSDLTGLTAEPDRESWRAARAAGRVEGRQ